MTLIYNSHCLINLNEVIECSATVMSSIISKRPPIKGCAMILPCVLYVMPAMQTPSMSDKDGMRVKIMQCVSSKGMMPTFSIAFNRIQEYKSKTREWQNLEDMIMQELANFGIIPRGELEQSLYLIAYTLSPRMDEILTITRLEPSEWDIDMFLMNPSLDSLISEAVHETFCRLELILSQETMGL